VQEPLAQILRYHHLALLGKLDDPAARLWYARQALEKGWSHNILVLQIERQAKESQGMAVSNFRDTLPPAESELAAQVFKDTHLFDFLGTADPRREKEVEQALVDHIQRFLLELGTGFAFAGQLNLYPPAVDDLLRHPEDQPTIGLLLCREKNRIVVEYALRNLKRPIGVAEWETKIVEKQPRRLAGSLPTVAEIEAESGAGQRERTRKAKS
jgi:predicted nuclease of restriction endonuclease-like (RecB) superfamily